MVEVMFLDTKVGHPTSRDSGSVCRADIPAKLGHVGAAEATPEASVRLDIAYRYPGICVFQFKALCLVHSALATMSAFGATT
jgi:hypothetical protein